MIDGRTAVAPNRAYPVITEPANVVSGQANTVPYVFYLPAIDTVNQVTVVPTQVTTVTTPRVPGAKVVIPANANLRNRDGSPVVAVSITPVPRDRTLTPLPSNVLPAMVFTIQLGGAIADVPMTVSYPNLTGANPGAALDLYAFNHDTVQWEKYGTGAVSADGRTVEPQTNPATGQPYGLTTFAWYFATPPAPPTANPNGNPNPNDDSPHPVGGNPVDFSSGMKIEAMTDVAFGGALGGVAFGHIYTSDLALGGVTGRFGRATRDNCDIRLTGSWQANGAGRLVMASEVNGGLFNYLRTDADGTLVFNSNETVSQLAGVIKKFSGGDFEYHRGDGSLMRFDSSGRLTAIVDRNSNTVTLTYSGANLTQITDPVGRSLTLQYDASNRISQVTDPLNRVWHYSYDSSGRLSVVDDPDPLGGTVNYGYNALHLLTSVTDKRGNMIKQITYDANGRVIAQQFADGGVENYAYTLSGRQVSGVTITDAVGRAQTMRFDAKGYVIEQTDGLGQSSRIDRDVVTSLATAKTGPCGCAEVTQTFDERGNVTSRTDRLGQTETIEYEPIFNNVTRFTDKLNRATSFAYDGHGNLTSITNALTQTVTFEYDPYGELTGVTDALNHTGHLEYDAQGNVLARVDAVNNRTTFEYDGVGRLTASNDPLGRQVSLVYDALDRLTSATDPSQATTHLGYDANGNQTSVTNALNQTWATLYDVKNRPVSSLDPLGRIATVQYDKADEVLAVFSPSGRKVSYSNDGRGQQASVTDPMGGVVRFAYDNRGNLTGLTDARGNPTTYSYDELFRPIATTDPLGRSATVSYDSVGNVVEAIDRLGRRTTFNYDALDRPAQVNYADATVSYSYDVGGRVTGLSYTGGGTLSWTYNEANRLLSESSAQGVVSYSYNAAGQVTSMTAANRPVVSYGYDPAGRLSSISQGSETFSYGYDALSRLTSLQRPNGVSSSYSYDVVSRLSRLTHQDTASQSLEDFQYSYNPDDEIEAITSLQSPQVLTATRTVGVANAANRIAQFSEASLTQDEEGQTTARSTSQGSSGLEWDARGRLKRAVLANGQAVSYAYDGLSRRVSRTANGVTTSFLYDGADVVVDSRSDGGSVDYLSGAGVDDKLR